ncbi:MAG: hypothetical protein JOZ58_19600 [Acetobacteraceae bacterium]|nr:hypothetical protein [Acetobacteraceae bacterium]MBV8577233.1 hypothetical protein [Acetobacteraceae bacterium]
MSCNAGVEAVQSAEGSMSGAATRGTAALPGPAEAERRCFAMLDQMEIAA